MAAIFEKAIERCQQQKFLEEVNASYAALKANRKKWNDEIAEIVRLTDGVPPGSVCPTFVFVLLSVIFFARRDELWGRFLTCGGLSIRLPPLDAPATAVENRHHSVCGLPLCGAGAFAQCHLNKPGVVRHSWSDLLGCHVGVRADVIRGMPVGIPAWPAKRLLHGAPQTSSTATV
jgi:hypothetical protein